MSLYVKLIKIFIDNLVKTISSYEIQCATLQDGDPIKKAYQGIIKSLQNQLK